jgi:hypothetical protein
MYGLNRESRIFDKILYEVDSSEGIFPTGLKYSQISPICKKGDKTVMSNYKPISFVDILFKKF